MAPPPAMAPQQYPGGNYAVMEQQQVQAGPYGASQPVAYAAPAPQAMQNGAYYQAPQQPPYATGMMPQQQPQMRPAFPQYAGQPAAPQPQQFNGQAVQMGMM